MIAVSRAITAAKLDARLQVLSSQDLLALTGSFNPMAASRECDERERGDLLIDKEHPTHAWHRGLYHHT